MKTVVGFNDWYRKSLQELEDIVEPPVVNKRVNNRTIILGTTEYLSPYLAYCVKYIKENTNKILPFIFFSLTEWTEEKNVQYIDCISYRKKGKIITILPQNREEWHPIIYRDGNPTTERDTTKYRITILELVRIYQNWGLDFPITKEEDDVKITITIDLEEINAMEGGKRSRRSRRKTKRIYKSKKKQSKRKV
jgi:hypothetical protein